MSVAKRVEKRVNERRGVRALVFIGRPFALNLAASIW
jgi:hypothetical protein